MGQKRGFCGLFKGNEYVANPITYNVTILLNRQRDKDNQRVSIQPQRLLCFLYILPSGSNPFSRLLARFFKGLQEEQNKSF